MSTDKIYNNFINYYNNIDNKKIENYLKDLTKSLEEDKSLLKEEIDHKSEKSTKIPLSLNKSYSVSFEEEILEGMIEEKIPLTEENKAYAIFLHKNKQPINQENIITLGKIKNKLSHISNSLTDKKIDEILKQGLNPEKISTFTLSDYISKSTDVDVENKEKSDEEIEKKENDAIKSDLNMDGVDEEALFSFESILMRSGLPVTQRNIANIKNLQSKFKSLNGIDKNIILSLIKRQGDITFEDLYTANHSGLPSNSQDINIENIKNLNEQIKNIFKEEGIDFNQENLNLAKDFIKEGIEVSFKNFKKYEKLDNINSKDNIYNILEKGVLNISKNKNILDINIFDNTYENIEKYQGYKDILQNVKVEHIQSLINKSIPINIKNIRKEYLENTQVENTEISDIAISERLNLAKVQMKLTMESIYRLSQQGINIDTKPLQEVINKLESIESEIYKENLKSLEVPVNTENLNKMQNLYSSLQIFYPSSVYLTFKDIIEENVDFSIKGINKSINSRPILETLEIFKTMPNRGFGDNINKLTGDFERLLKDNGFEVTKNNIKALKILSLNNIEFNEENILNVKLIDEKIEYVHNNLHPMIASKMLKDGFDPMDRNINDLIEYIDEFSKEFGQTSKEKIAEQILNIDNENKLSKEERNAIVSIYRMLNSIEKSESSSIGTLLKSGKKVTLGNLLEASKIYDKRRKNIDFDKKIDETTGEREYISSENNIADSIEKVLNKNFEYNKFILNQIIDYSSPNKLFEIFKSNKEIDLEAMLDILKEDEPIKMYDETKKEIISHARNLENIEQDAINYIIKNNIPITLNNIQNIENIIKDGLSPSKKIDDFRNELLKRGISFGESILDIDKKESLDLEKALETVDNLKEENTNVFDEIINLDELNDIKYMILKNKNVSSSLKFLQDNNSIKNGLYSMPLKFSDGKIVDLNMLILNDKSLDDKNLNMLLSFSKLKDDVIISAYIKVSDNGTLANISTKTEEAFKNIKNYEEDVLKILSKFDIIPDKLIYSKDEEQSIYNDNFRTNVEEKFKYIEGKFNELI